MALSLIALSFKFRRNTTKATCAVTCRAALVAAAGIGIHDGWPTHGDSANQAIALFV